MKTILVVEDEPALLAILMDKLTHEGFVALGARDGKEGLQVALTSHPDLILLDIIMPVMDGFTMLSKLRTDPWGKTASVIMLTNLSSAEKVAQADELGISDYIVKSDFKIDDVVRKVRAKLEI